MFISIGARLGPHLLSLIQLSVDKTFRMSLTLPAIIFPPLSSDSFAQLTSHSITQDPLSPEICFAMG